MTTAALFLSLLLLSAAMVVPVSGFCLEKHLTYGPVSQRHCFVLLSSSSSAESTPQCPLLDPPLDPSCTAEFAMG